MRHRNARWLGAVAALLVMVFAAPLIRARARASSPITFTDGDGIHVLNVQAIDSRQYNVRVSSPALGRAVDVRILLPAGYSDHAASRYPVLYLFHGTSGRASDWVKFGGAEQATAALPLITVMPDAGFDGDGGGWFTNWYDTKTALGPSQWETFHVDQVIPWVDANLRTIARREGRAIAGLSQGGFGSTTYSARHPDLFVSAASFSGAPDIDNNPFVAAGATAIIQATATFLDNVEPDAMFGPRATNEINWQGHDPADLATNMRGVDTWLYTASGAPGPYDPPPPNPYPMGIEFATHESTLNFYDRAQQGGVPVHLVDYGNGTHTWPYWARDLREYLVPLMATFATPPAPPQDMSYRSVDRSWSQWGWTVSLDRQADEQFSSLTYATASGFTLRGAGTATVVTPSLYRPNEALVVSVAGPNATATRTVSADGDGHLRLTIPLGGDNVPAAVARSAVVGDAGVPAWGATAVVGIWPVR